MSVRSSDRTESKLEVIYQATKLEEALNDLSLRSFGIRSRNSPLRRKYEMAVRISGDSEKIDTIINERSNRLRQYANDILMLVQSANSIFPHYRFECEERISLQNHALETCAKVKSELTSIVGMFDVRVDTFRTVTLLLEKEIDLIKRWRSKDRTRLEGLPL